MIWEREGGREGEAVLSWGGLETKGECTGGLGVRSPPGGREGERSAGKEEVVVCMRAIIAICTLHYPGPG